MENLTAEEIQTVQKHYDAVKEGIEEKLHKLRTFASEYQALKEYLPTAQEKVKVPCLVPIVEGLAYMPGYIKHTNKVMASIGANYFIQLSTKEAVAMANRKQDGIKEMIVGLEKSLQENELKRATLSEIKGEELNEEGLPYIDIQEEYTEEDVIQKPESVVAVAENKNMDDFDLALLRKLQQMEEEEEGTADKTIANEQDAAVETETHAPARPKSAMKSPIPHRNRAKSVTFDPELTPPEVEVMKEKVMERNPHSIMKKQIEERPIVKDTIKERVQERSSTIMKNDVVEKATPVIMRNAVMEREVDSDDESDLEEQALGQHVSLEYMLKRERLIKAKMLDARSDVIQRDEEDEQSHDNEQLEDEPIVKPKMSLFKARRSQQ
jgi:prefoldin alpha subunit